MHKHTITRRDFLGTTAALGAGAVMFPAQRPQDGTR